MEQLASREWWEAAGTRALKTWAQAMIAAMPTTAATLGGVDWALCLSTACVAAVLSLLTSLAGLPEVGTQESEGGED